MLGWIRIRVSIEVRVNDRGHRLGCSLNDGGHRLGCSLGTLEPSVIVTIAPENATAVELLTEADWDSAPEGVMVTQEGSWLCTQLGLCYRVTDRSGLGLST